MCVCVCLCADVMWPKLTVSKSYSSLACSEWRYEQTMESADQCSKTALSELYIFGREGISIKGLWTSKRFDHLIFTWAKTGRGTRCVAFYSVSITVTASAFNELTRHPDEPKILSFCTYGLKEKEKCDWNMLYQKQRSVSSQLYSNVLCKFCFSFPSQQSWFYFTCCYP